MICRVEGGGVLAWVIPAGRRVIRGAVIARLDTTQLEKLIRAQQIEVARVDAEYEICREARVILEGGLAREREAAELVVVLAGLDRLRYLEGEYKTDRGRLTRLVTLTGRRAVLAGDRLKRARQLADRGLLSRGQLDSDRAGLERAETGRADAVRELSRLETSRHKRRLLELDAALAAANEQLTMSKRDAESARRGQAAMLAARRLAARVAVGRLEELAAQRRLSTITAPVAGIVIHPEAGDAGQTGRSLPARGRLLPGTRLAKWQLVLSIDHAQPVSGSPFKADAAERSSRSDSIISAVDRPVVVRRIVPAGTRVRAGETLVELDSTPLDAEVRQQQVTVARVRAEMVAQQRALARSRAVARSAELAANRELKAAGLDLEEFERTRFARSRSRLDVEIGGLVADRRRATERVAWSERVLKKGYITPATLETDRLTLSEVENKLATARGRLGVLLDHTCVRQLAELNARRTTAANDVARVRREGTAEVAQAQARALAGERTQRLESAALADLTEQVAACTIRASRPGVVVELVPAPGGSPPQAVAGGTTVHKGQPLLVLRPRPGVASSDPPARPRSGRPRVR